MPGRLNGQAGFTNAAGANQGQQAAGGISQTFGNLRQFFFSADKGGRVGRKIMQGSRGAGEQPLREASLRSRGAGKILPLHLCSPAPLLPCIIFLPTLPPLSAEKKNWRKLPNVWLIQPTAC